MMQEYEGSTDTAPDLKPEFFARLDQIAERGYEMMPSSQTAGVVNLSAPILGPDGKAIAALTIPYITLINTPGAPDISQTIELVVATSRKLSEQAGLDIKTTE
jgi:DNA-binding IclR family transcriptional regulator